LIINSLLDAPWLLPFVDKGEVEDALVSRFCGIRQCIFKGVTVDVTFGLGPCLYLKIKNVWQNSSFQFLFLFLSTQQLRQERYLPVETGVSLCIPSSCTNLG
jgi:hypothetical protein